ncbi:hypothetical protein A8C32_03220 [Flavivirga aquatica]|uniref:Polysaccharide biosynthesis protein CapD-like domain-containing protein n=1 Tax=Flavivirga aquatica TaxID=1849968 RepID=A0A1E5TAQ3_9FLAO|nr:polysaccharide biosynthesis protein [Flavivirga aquatica]OEK08475.1 hypothetical protein A8C32_03220 [Flavivirga aquatica]
MNISTSNYIDQLLLDSDLFPFKRKPKKNTHSFDFSNETILITGAAGSIGSELSRQLSIGNYKKLILIDVAESPLYSLIKDLEFENVSNIDFIILNITEKESLNRLFETHKPSIVIHTAAYKHVPLMESNPYEAVKLNILGTKLLADLSVKYQVKKFVFISTDKAVKPISVMGISKRIAEDYLVNLAENCNTVFLTTRFGNILGSNGSVVPLFKKQIELGKPLTITDKTISRYFISKHKACYLILKIANYNNVESNIFTFNMGNPIRIIDIAERLISLYQDLEETIEIKTTGLRPGEKRHEDIIADSEKLIPTESEDVFLVKEKNKTVSKKVDFTPLFDITPSIPIKEIKSVLESYL